MGSAAGFGGRRSIDAALGNGSRRTGFNAELSGTGPEGDHYYLEDVVKQLAFGMLAAVAVAGTAGSVEAQEVGALGIPVALEVRGGAAFPVGNDEDDFGSDEAGADTGYGFGANVFVGLTPILGVYGGYSRFSFSAEPEDSGEDIFPGGVDVDYVDSGFNVGAQLVFSSIATLQNATPWLRGGAIFHEFEFEVEDEGAEVSFSTDREVGFEAGGGLNIPLGEVISITPGVRYVAYSPQFEFEGEESEPVNIRYIIADVGLQIRF